MRRGITWLASGIFLMCLTTAIATPAKTFTRLHSFTGMDGSHPYARMVQAANGNLYGTTYDGGENGFGTVFKITPSGKLTTIHSFSRTDGANPVAGLVQAANGNLYGTTYYGGANGKGVVFKIAPSGKLTTLHSFAGTDGAYPYAGLVQATNGNLYGTTWRGGDYDDGTVFKITPNGKLTTLHNFCSQSNCADGGNPFAELVQATNGSLYGTTFGFGGGACGGNQSAGTVFKITIKGKLTTLHTFFLGPEDGACPDAGLVQATDGNFYGTTFLGGIDFWDGGYGTVFKITPSGDLTMLYRFCTLSNCPDGANPEAGLVRASDGNFYGTTLLGGIDFYCGTVFKITPNGKLTTLHNFAGTDGARPYAGLVQATNGNLYGTTFGGGHNGLGTVFSLSVSAPEQAGSK